jgi:NADPH:quinone reductase-like Zn-dependent oxidoreductase
MCTGAGAYAEYAVTDGGRAVQDPRQASPYEEATILTLALQTMHNASSPTASWRAARRHDPRRQFRRRPDGAADRKLLGAAR